MPHTEISVDPIRTLTICDFTIHILLNIFSNILLLSTGYPIRKPVSAPSPAIVRKEANLKDLIQYP